MIKYFELARSKNRVCCEFPNKCPICNNSISPENKMEYYNYEIKKVAILFSCPACYNGFVSHYKFTNEERMSGSLKYHFLELIDSYPKEPPRKEFDECIKKISSKFCEIYNQAFISEFYKLNQLSGMGYRKSLEFLLKDYCIYKKPDEYETIQSMPLSQVINEYVESEKIKNLSKASTWIGNDETHYIRKFEDKDINDLKKFIDATVAFITYDITSDEASQMISS